MVESTFCSQIWVPEVAVVGPARQTVSTSPSPDQPELVFRSQSYCKSIPVQLGNSQGAGLLVNAQGKVGGSAVQQAEAVG